MYGASKAALELYTETLRLEVAPFGVRVLTVVSGVVATNIMAHAPEDYHLPSDSMYQKIFKEIKARAYGEDVKASSKMDAAKFADRVVSDVLGGKSGRVWRGAMATAVWLMMKFMPSFLLVSF